MGLYEISVEGLRAAVDAVKVECEEKSCTTQASAVVRCKDYPAGYVLVCPDHLAALTSAAAAFIEKVGAQRCIFCLRIGTKFEEMVEIIPLTSGGAS